MDKNERVGLVLKCTSQPMNIFVVIIILTILVIVMGIFLYKNLYNTKIELESCRSSLSSS
jgi:cell division protein FtsL